MPLCARPAALLLLRAALAVGVYLLAQYGQQAAILLLRFFPPLKLLQAGVNQIREILYGIAAFGRGGHRCGNR